MKAAILSKKGEGRILQVKDSPKPFPEDDQVVIKVEAAGANPFDYKVRDSILDFKVNLPLILGGDVAGIVTAVGKNVTTFRMNDEVYGQANALKQGSLAEYCSVNVQQLALKPKISFEEAAALPLASCSAYQALIDTFQLKANDKILIHGGAGGIGSQAIQLARRVRAKVATTASARDRQYLKNLGASIIIDYINEDFSQIIKDFDYVFDTVGGKVLDSSYQVLHPGGVIVSMVGQSNQKLARHYKIKVISQQTQTTEARLKEIAKLVNDHDLTVNIDRIFSLDQINQALDYLKNDHPRGKVIIKP
jgi:NADPH:quinone reductase-like Zn-dependent oxidoreductase